ncbi:hypothetical protein [Rhodospirillum sp. A1_3_36]|uniref:hypothetical protein n=1 Tax=Rhodospirillum sp. A1_3_36 TaxID=3391666 RepID=UPI0039A6886C
MPSILAKYTDATETALTRSDMPGAIIPAVPENRHFAELRALGLEIAPSDVAQTDRASVKAEARNRILARYPEWKQRNMALLAATLTAKGEMNWSSDEQTQWESIAVAWDAINAIRSRSNEIEALDPLPSDLSNDELWS